MTIFNNPEVIDDVSREQKGNIVFNQVQQREQPVRCDP